MSDGSGITLQNDVGKSKEIQHCHCLGPFISFNCGLAVSKCSHIHAQHFQSTCGRHVFQHEIVTLNYWEFAVFDDAHCSFVWFRLCLAFGRMMCTMVEMGCE